jgi:hypothetical protein
MDQEEDAPRAGRRADALTHRRRDGHS